MACDRDGELLDQHAEFADLADHRLNAVGAGGIGRRQPALDRGEPAAEFGDLTREIGGAARQIHDLAADVGAVAQPHRHRVVEDQEGQRGERDDRGFQNPPIPATEYRTSPRDAATSTMQMAMKIVEMRIMLRATLPQARQS